MKKSSVIIAVSVLIVLLIGLLYLDISYNSKKKAQSGSSNLLDSELSETSAGKGNNSITYGEYKYVLSGSITINARYMKINGGVKIFSVYPVEDKSKYDISYDGSTAVYLSKDGSIWALFNDGSSKKITPDKYGSIEKSAVQKENLSYIWAEQPLLTGNGTVRFVSNLPDTGSKPKKSLWEINIDNGDIKKIYTLASDNFKLLGYREDGRLLILDGGSISAINTNDSSAENIDVKDKYILSMSPEGDRILYVKLNKDNQPDFSSLYTMDDTGANSIRLPGLDGYSPTQVGAWSSDGTKYAFVVRSTFGSKDKIAVISFDEDSVVINSFIPTTDVKFPDNSTLRWGTSDSVSVDTGDDVINIDVKAGN